MCKPIAISWAILLLGTSALSAATIVVGDHVLLPNTPDQTIPVWVSGVERAAALNFNVQIGDGLGPDSGGQPAPTISHVDILYHPAFGNTIFGAVPNDGERGFGAITDLLYEIYTLTELGSVVADGLLGVITIDTTGFWAPPPQGNWPLILSQTLNAPTDMREDTPLAEPIPLFITDGTVSILIPEPATLTLLLSFVCGLPLLGMLARRSRSGG